MLKITPFEEISISGKSNRQRINVRWMGEKGRGMRVMPDGRGGWFTQYGDSSLRQKFKEFCIEQFKEEVPPFADLFQRVKELNPKSKNPKTPTWLQ